MWRLGHRVGDAVSGHGPDADRIADGERDFTVPAAVSLFFVGYAVVAVVVASVAASVDAAPSTARVVWWSLLMTLAVAAPAIAIGSGRAAIWAALAPRGRARRRGRRAVRAGLVPRRLRAGLRGRARSLGAGEAATMMSQLHLSAGDAVVYSLVNVGLAPNAVLFSGSFLLGPGFAVGGGTMVSPGPGRPRPAAPAAAAGGAAGRRRHRRLGGLPRRGPAASSPRSPRPGGSAAARRCAGTTARCAAAAAASWPGVAFAVLASVAGGAAGPGRMRHVGPFVPDVLVHAITAFGVGGLVGGLAMTWWQRRRAARDGA